ncbi:MAG TPA: glycoside hydrolase family 6 protein [Nonomuraea sp.]|nr:glycoside hydrolase family 6 protein [Nonomuraea sp.]
MTSPHTAHPARSRRWRIAAAAITCLAAGGLTALVPTSPANAAVACSVDYQTNDWGSGFTATIKITNTGDPLTSWTLGFAFSGNQRVQQGWSATWNQSGANVTAQSMQWNGALATGASTSIGFNGSYSGTNAAPTAFTINGTACNGGGPGNQAPTVALTSPAPNAGFTAPATVNLAANASDSDGTVTGVSFFNGSTLLTTDTQAPYSYSWANVAAGTYTVTARATDDDGATTTSDPVSVVVSPATGDPAIVPGSASVSVSEGGTASVPVRLSRQPSGTVTVNTARTSGDADLTVASGGTLTFTTGNWNTPQDVVIRAAEDTDETNGSATFTSSGTGLTSATFTATEADNDGDEPGPSEPHQANPFTGATAYLNPDYSAKLEESATQESGTTASRIRALKNVPTAVWLDRIAAIEGTDTSRGLRDHLDAALAQKQGNTPITANIVVYDLPNRDCAALASNGELLISQNGSQRYRTEYVDPIADIVADPKYAGVRIVVILEPDSLPNLVTNLSTPACAEANSTNAYRDGIRYAISKLTVPDNVYIYLDIAHSGWLGWSNNFNQAITLYRDTIAGSGGPGWNTIDGFVSNTANYTPTEEPFLTNPQLNVGGQQVQSATFYEFNPMFDERDYVTQWRSSIISAGAPDAIGMLIDTSRNGWGGANRPTAVSTSTQLNPYVNESKIDRRPHRGGWCNQNGAGVGARPAASPFAGVDAFVWVKPPGESDGVSDPGVVDPNDPNKKFDAMCDPDAQNRYNSQFPTNALPGAPHAGRWFHDQLVMLVNNAFPAL